MIDGVVCVLKRAISVYILFYMQFLWVDTFVGICVIRMWCGNERIQLAWQLSPSSEK